MDYQIVNRDALHFSGSSRDPTPGVDGDASNTFRALLNRRFGLVEDIEPDNAPDSSAPHKSAEEDEEMGFRLFASQSASAKIDLRSPSPNAGFVGTKRPDEYYFTGPLSDEQREKLEAAALSGSEVLELSRTRWAGCALPWKVSVASAGETLDTTKVLWPQSKLPRKRRRPSKKARIALRVKFKAQEEKEEEAKRAAQDKEQYLREKKSAENRKKQLKRRAKEKAKKAELEALAQDTMPPAD